MELLEASNGETKGIALKFEDEEKVDKKDEKDEKEENGNTEEVSKESGDTNME